MSGGPGACFIARSHLALLGGLLLVGCTGAPSPPAGMAASEEAQVLGSSATQGHDEPAQRVLPPDEVDAPLPEEDEIPAFLGPREPAGAAASPGLETAAAAEPAPGDDGEALAAFAVGGSMPAHGPTAAAEPTLAELLKQVRFTDEGGDDEEGSFASVIVTDRGAAPEAGGGGPGTSELGTTRGTDPVQTGDASGRGSPSPPEAAATNDEDPCAGIQAALADYQAYLERIGAERTAFAYVESDEDATALRLLQAMRRCAEFPDDPDCKAPPMEVELRDVEPPRHTYESWPTELLAEDKDPDEIAHDPRIRELVHQLQRCRTRQKAQPLLE